MRKPMELAGKPELIIPGRRIGRSVAFGAALAFSACTVWAQAPAGTSLLNQPPSAPEIQTTGGELTIQAQNSSLRAILDAVQSRTGTQVKGIDHDIRVFGTYGPGKPSEVLSSLLDDSGYNIMIAGTQDNGFPRDIELSNRIVVNAAPPSQPTTQASSEDADDAADDSAPPAPEQPTTPLPQNPTPFVPPSNNGQQGQQQVKTPQQLLQELQQLRQQQQQQQTPQQ